MYIVSSLTQGFFGQGQLLYPALLLSRLACLAQHSSRTPVAVFQKHTVPYVVLAAGRWCTLPVSSPQMLQMASKKCTASGMSCSMPHVTGICPTGILSSCIQQCSTAAWLSASH